MITVSTYRAACRRILAGVGTAADYRAADRYHAQAAAEALAAVRGAA